MGWQPGAGGESDPADGVPGGASGPSGGTPRDARLAGFAQDGEWDTRVPSAALAAVLEAVSGPQWRCPGAGHDELLGVLRRWTALESWAAAGKLGVLRALIREEDLPLPGEDRHGDLPDGWSRSLTHEVALALAMPPQSAESLMSLAWSLHAALPGIGALLAGGTLTAAKARAVTDALSGLREADMATAEAMIVPLLAGKTYGQAEKLAVQAAVTADPESAARRREDAERNSAKVSLRRGPSGAASLSGYDLPTDETLAAHAQVCARAQEYKDSGAFTGVRMDQLRARAYLDILNGITTDARISAGQPDTGLGASGDPGRDDPGRDDPGRDDPGSDEPGSDGGGTDDGGTDDDGPRGPGGTSGTHPGSGDSGTSTSTSTDGEQPGGPSPAAPPPEPPRSEPPRSKAPPPALSLPRPSDLVIPLATLLGLARRPGEGHGLGPLDPDLCRALAATAAGSPHTTVCVTVTSPQGYAAGHGCARPARPRRHQDQDQAGKCPSPGDGNGENGTTPAGSPPGARTALPARLNLTITSTLLAGLAQAAPPEGAPGGHGPPGPRELGSWSFIRTGDPGPPGGYGRWELTLPDGRTLIVELEPVPAFGCDHRRESHAYKPGDALRHLVQVRDYECTFPTCSRHARESDFEHAIPYHRGGRTCGCNAGSRSRQCHQVKQSPGWDVTQKPRPGWHRWTTPSGRVYLQEPKRYPV